MMQHQPQQLWEAEAGSTNLDANALLLVEHIFRAYAVPIAAFHSWNLRKGLSQLRVDPIPPDLPAGTDTSHPHCRVWGLHSDDGLHPEPAPETQPQPACDLQDRSSCALQPRPYQHCTIAECLPFHVPREAALPIQEVRTLRPLRRIDCQRGESCLLPPAGRALSSW